MPDKHYDVFLSHNSDDKPVVERLAHELRAAGFEPFLDKWHLIPGEPWQEALEEALDQSNTCAVFLGPSDLGPWENEEMRAALDERVHTPDFRVIPVLLPDAQMPERGRLPRFLSRLTWVDFRAGIESTDALYRLVCGIKGISPGPLEDSGLLVEDVCPYRGLQPFREEDAEFFFGREALTQWLVEGLRKSQFLVVIGPSGSGKSSVVRAGLVPALRRGALPNSDKWKILVLTPGVRPLEELAAHLTPFLQNEDDRVTATLRFQDSMQVDQRTLHTAVRLALANRSSSVRFLIVVDQFEELFTLCPNEKERQCFLANLLYASGVVEGRITAVLAMRADFYARTVTYPELADRIADHQVAVTPMLRDELLQAIESPAHRVGLTFDTGLVDTIVEDVLGEPGVLPLLEHALLELWRHRRGQRFTFNAYQEIGGVATAIARRAEAEFAELSGEQQVVARRVLLRLVQPGEGTEDTRRRAHLSELVSDPEHAHVVESVVRSLADARLLTTSLDAASGEELIDVAHEALVRGWPRLRTWLDEDRAALRTHRRLTDRAQEWVRLNRDKDSLLRGAQLAETEEWAQQHGEEMNLLEREFLDASGTLRGQEAEEKEEQQRKELQAAHQLAQEAEARRRAEEDRAREAEVRAREQAEAASRLRRWATGLAVVGLLAIALAVTTFLLLRTAELRGQMNLARQLASQALISMERKRDAELSLLLALESKRIAYDANIPHLLETDDALRRALVSAPAAILRHQAPVSQLAFGANGARFATASDDGMVRLVDTATLKAVATVQHKAKIDRLVFSPNGSRLAITSNDGTFRLLDAITGKDLALLYHEDEIRDLAFCPNGQRVATASLDGTAYLLNAQTGDKLAVLHHKNAVVKVAFSSDGTCLATASWDGTAHVVHAETGNELITLHHDFPVVAISFSPNGALLATASYPLVTSDDSTLLLPLYMGQENDLVAADFLPRMTRLWNVATGVELANLRHEGEYWAVSTGSGMETVFGPGSIGVGGVNPRSGMQADEDGAQLVFSPDGVQLATTTSDNIVYMLDVLSGEKVDALYHEGIVKSVVFSPNGRQMATISTASLWSDDRVVRLFDTSSGADIAMLHHQGDVTRVIFSSDGRHFASAGYDGMAYLLDVDTGVILTVVHLEDSQVDIAFSPDGSQLAVAGGIVVYDLSEEPLYTRDSRIEVVDVETGFQVATFAHGGPIRDIAYNPSGSLLATASFDHTARLWNVEIGIEPITLRHAAYTYEAIFSPNGERLATASRDCTARLIDMTSGIQMTTFRDNQEISSVVFSLDGTRFATASIDGTSHLVDATLGVELATLHHQAWLRQVAFSPDGTLLATASDDGTARLWDAFTGTELKVFDHGIPVWQVAFSQDGTRLATVGSSFSPSEDGYSISHLWDTVSGKQLKSVRHEGSSAGPSITFGADGKRLAIIGPADGSVRMIDAVQGNELYTLYQDTFERTALNSDGTRLVTVDGKGSIVHLTDAATGAELASFPTGGAVGDIVFSPDGTKLVLIGHTGSTSGNSIVYLVDAIAGDEILTERYKERVEKPVFSSDSSKIVVLVDNGTSRLLRADDGNELAVLQAISQAIFSPDGTQLAVSSNGSVRLLNSNRGTEIATLSHENPVDDIVFSPDGAKLAISSRDGTIHLWDSTTGEKLAVLSQEGYVSNPVFSPDGTWLMTSSLEGVVRLWRVETDELEALACRILSRNLTQDEWLQYIGEDPYRPTCPGLSGSEGELPSIQRKILFVSPLYVPDLPLLTPTSEP